MGEEDSMYPQTITVTFKLYVTKTLSSIITTENILKSISLKTEISCSSSKGLTWATLPSHLQQAYQ